MLTIGYLHAWLSAFVFTQIVEMPIYRRGLDCSWRAAFLASALTHPVVWFVFFHHSVRLSYYEKFVAAELFAFLAEAAYFRFLLHKRRALLWALIANTASVALGILSRRLFGAP